MPASPSISVVIPCYNVEAYIEECIDSVLAQTYRPVDLICVDDGSTDRTLDTLRALHTSSGGYVQVIATENRGASAARNTGAKRAQGTYIQFLDADDLIAPQKLEHQSALIQQRATPPDLIAASYEKKTLDGKEDVIGVASQDPWLSLLASQLGCTCSNLWRKTALQQVGYWNERYPSSQNTELMFRLLKRGAQILFDSACYTTVRKRRRSIGTTRHGEWPAENKERYFRLRADVIRYLHDRGLLTAERMDAGAQLIFELIRSLYEFDRSAAVQLHDQVFPPDFTPRVGFNTRSYILCYRLFGFEYAQRIRALFHTVNASFSSRPAGISSPSAPSPRAGHTIQKEKTPRLMSASARAPRPLDAPGDG